MLTIRFQPRGKKHNKSYSIVVAEKHRQVAKKFIEKLGWYNPNTKEIVLEADRVKHYVQLNLEMSDSVRSLLRKQGFLK